MVVKLDFNFLLFRICEVHIRAPRARYVALHDLCFSLLGSNLLPAECQVIPDLAESSSLVFWQFVSAGQTTPRTANTCGNVFVLPRAMIATIGQIIPRTLLL